MRETDTSYTFNSHAASHGVTHETARTDLRALVDKGLLEAHRQGRKYFFTPAPRLHELLKDAA